MISHRDLSSPARPTWGRPASVVLLAALGLGTLACPNPKPHPPIHPVDAGPILNPCGLVGSWSRPDGGDAVQVGDAGLPDLSWVTVPAGFCVHHYATVQNARQLRFAPGGELFVAAPSMPVASGDSSQRDGGLVVIPDDNADGTGDSVDKFASWPATQGFLFANGGLYYQVDQHIWREPYLPGQRQDLGGSVEVADVEVYHSGTHWPKTLDIADDGTIYVGNGGDQSEGCVQPMPFHGGIVSINENSTTPDEVAMGMRNPIAVRCHHDGQNHCFAVELALDGSAVLGGREKLVPIHAGDNWGFPCCATANVPYQKSNPPDCSAITSEANAFLIGNTPFGLDFSDAHFPAPWDHQVFVALHGAVGSWAGARIVAIPLDSSSGMPLPGWTTDGGFNEGAVADFATGWDTGHKQHGRPTDIAFSGDGRMFVTNDFGGEIFWVAPITQPQQ